jgi:hypothetical protein
MAKEIDPSIFDGNFIKEVDPIIKGKRKRRQILMKCLVCQSEFTTSLDNAKRTKQKTCSNACAGKYREKFEGGCENHPLYPRWLSMRDRCNNPNNPRYPRYGGRGITVDPYFDSFENYVNTLIALDNCPKDLNNTTMQIDRIDNDLGYFPANLRWANTALNGANKTHSQEYSSSRYRGIHFCNTHKRWIATITHNGRKILASHHKTEEDAVKARNTYIKEHHLAHPIQKLSNV